MEDLNILEPQFGFWTVTVTIEKEVEGPKGDVKVKKVKELHLVDGVSLKDVEVKVADAMKGTMEEWKITKCVQAGINYVY